MILPSAWSSGACLSRRRRQSCRRRLSLHFSLSSPDDVDAPFCAPQAAANHSGLGGMPPTPPSGMPGVAAAEMAISRRTRKTTEDPASCRGGRSMVKRRPNTVERSRPNMVKRSRPNMVKRRPNTVKHGSPPRGGRGSLRRSRTGRAAGRGGAPHERGEPANRAGESAGSRGACFGRGPNGGLWLGRFGTRRRSRPRRTGRVEKAPSAEAESELRSAAAEAGQ